eukprot:CAMPEP_0184130086 /NCGR_PEP_ID=MMETSP0974-20121125/27418_1 /TAXON_ID=483370 /ORGANISM="non described non described, Strain CCMP2097" /LENGTH=56 /DNA_ID=CAMNT_0026433537 /DNA_START=276 /DNA_END=443 /DNA_ORIENTATION=+
MTYNGLRPERLKAETERASEGSSHGVCVSRKEEDGRPGRAAVLVKNTSLDCACPTL